MLQAINFFARSLIVAALLYGGQALGATRLEPLTVGYSNITATYAPLWIAVEERVGVKYGLDLKAIYAGRVRPQQLLATGDVPVVIASGTGHDLAYCRGQGPGAGGDNYQ
jgi:hypothetical protein